MDPAHIDDQAQRTLEQRALKNVHELARRLGYSDALDRYGERFVVIGLGVAVFLVVSAVVVSFVMAPVDPRLDELKRCEVDKAADIVWEKRKAYKARHPQTSDQMLEQLFSVVHNDVKGEAASRCANAKSG